MSNNSKYRVFELAKEYHTSSKDIMELLSKNEVPVKNHMSNVDEKGIDLVRKHLGKQQAPQGQQAPRPQGQQAPRPQGQQAPRPQGQQAPRPQGQQAPRPQGQQAPRPQGQQAPRPQGQQAPRPQGQQAPRPQGQQAPRPQGQQAPRPQGQQAPRPQGQQAPRPQGQQAPRPQGQQGQRPQGQHENFGGQQQRAGGQRGGQQQRSQGGPQRRQGGSGGGQRFNNQRGGNQRGGQRFAPAAPKQEMPKPKQIRIGESLSVKELASKLGRDVGEVIKKLMMMGVMATINQEIDFDTACLLGEEFGTAVEALPPEEDPTEVKEIEDDPKSLQPRPPVVTVMGHVDHGKTSLLDVIRKTHVTEKEAGGITQHIGAYQVVYQGKKITFLDTPGHEAFTAMRARGAQVTDVAILVVAADDGVMPQTIEAINHAKAAEVPIIVAINKMDRPGANPDQVKQQLMEHGLIAEDWGGDTIMVPVSAHQKTGISDLLEMILLVAEVQELKANPNRNAMGTIVEAQLDKGRGTVATVLVQKGTLTIGDAIIAGSAYGRVRAMVNDRGDRVKKAGPSMPVEVLGLTDVPEAGDVLIVVDDEKTARTVAEKRQDKKRSEEIKESQKVSLDDLFKQIQDGQIKDLNVVIKADVQGSVEALRQALMGLNTNEEVRVIIVHAGVGAINESDVMLASAANALIIGFNVRPDGNARKTADAEKIDIRTYRVIYDAINDVEAALTGMLASQFKEVVLGRAEVRMVISVPKTVVAGSYVLEGKITNSSQVRILRNGIVLHEGTVEALRRFKDDVKEVAQGYECGISVEKFRDIKEGDIIEAFVMEEVRPTSL
ncbi:translation initiation factor IF-2 [Anaeroarcus burkinensis]|uniref:translation initiation factor IF-2 n=2 Tax=Sporomusaceae TaxID=1843490 RepID=UPI00040843BA|nr:translation initiation factor IF-2 [Anaeroarcus burkinensis]